MLRAEKTHKNSDYFSLENPDYKNLVDFYLFNELKRDSGHGDLTCDLLFEKNNPDIKAKIFAKSEGVLAGVYELDYFLKSFDLELKWLFKDGDNIKKGNVVLELAGEAKTILKIERQVLNFLGRLSGVASDMNRCVESVEGRVLVCPTRKTYWGLLDKKACLIGGGGTHRLTAGSAFMAKENHLITLAKSEGVKGKDLKALGSIIKDADAKNFGQYCEIEVETELEAEEACEVLKNNLPKGVQGVVMFDNFDPGRIVNMVGKLKEEYPGIIFEASGGITIENIPGYAKTGVDIVSLGEVTHSSHNFDFSLRVVG